MKVLIIEDDSRLALILRHFLEPIASSITVAANMEEALKIVAEADDLSLITLDLGLPDSDVTSTIRKIKDIRLHKPDALIVVVTGQDMPDLEQFALASGADGVIYKQDQSFTAAGFLQVLYAIVQKYLQNPQNYKRSIAILEKVAQKIGQIKHENGPSSTVVAVS